MSAVFERILSDTMAHEKGLQIRLEELASERKEVKRTLRALARYRKHLGAHPPPLPGLDEPDEAARDGQADLVEAAANVSWDHEEDEPEHHGEPVLSVQQEDDIVSRAFHEAAAQSAIPKRRKRSKANGE